jgi:hyperosmotically inducible periplasmic protein
MKLYKLAVITMAAVALLALSIPAQASKMDDRIESSAKKSYVFRTYLQDDDVNIQSRNGAVTLTGTVSEESHKSLAEETVTGLPGVKSVNNRLEIRGESPTANSDAWITTKVKTVLMYHRNVNAMTQVDTQDGIVTLRGDASNQAEKDLTTEYVKDVEGVKDVNNEMTVNGAPTKAASVIRQMDDASITAMVKMTLLYHRSTSAHNTSVTTKNGVVTLTGRAGNAAETDLAAKYARDVNGVKSVKNRMTIQ